MQGLPKQKAKVIPQVAYNRNIVDPSEISYKVGNVGIKGLHREGKKIITRVTFCVDRTGDLCDSCLMFSYLS